MFALSNFIEIRVEIVDWRVIADCCLAWSHEDAPLVAWRFEQLFAGDLVVRVSSWVIEENAEPVTSTETLDFANVLDFTTSLANLDFAAVSHFDSICLLFLEIVVSAVAVWLHKVRVLLLHVRLEFAEGIITLVVVLLADVVLFNLRHVVPLANSVWA